MHPSLASAALFRGVDRSDAAQWCARLDSWHFSPGQFIFEQGDPGDLLYIIVAGKVKVGYSSADGRENLFSILGPSDMFGEMSILDPGPRMSTATALTDVEAVGKVLGDFTDRGWIRLRGKGVIISQAERLALRADLRPGTPDALTGPAIRPGHHGSGHGDQLINWATT